MDHLQEAVTAMSLATKKDESWMLLQAQLAQAHALIALVERLDKLITIDAADQKRGFLRVETPYRR